MGAGAAPVTVRYDRLVTVTVVLIVLMMMVMVVVMVTMVVTIPVRPFESVRGHLPAFERRYAVARGLAVVAGHAKGAVDAGAAMAVHRVPTAQPHAPREEQLEEQSLELLAEYHVYDEVDGRVDGHEQVAHFDQLIDGDPVERLGHVQYERRHVAQQEHHDHAEQHGGQSDLLLLQPREPLPFPVGQPHLQHMHQR